MELLHKSYVTISVAILDDDIIGVVVELERLRLIGAEVNILSSLSGDPLNATCMLSVKLGKDGWTMPISEKLCEDIIKWKAVV